MTGCYGDGVRPHDPAPSLRIIAGANITDTISTQPPQWLIVEVRGKDGRTRRGVEVHFEARPSSRMEVSGVVDEIFKNLVVTQTDATGRAVTRTRMGMFAGTGWITVRVPADTLQDTAYYTILPGAATTVQVLPQDTALNLGSSFSYRGTVRDRAGNARTDPVTYEGSGEAVVARVTLLGTVSVTVVPQVTILTSGATGIAPLRISDLTGANQNVVDPNGLAASWEPGGNRFVYTRGDSLAIAHVGGSRAAVATPGITSPTWPEWSSDGQWIHFHGTAATGDHVYRIRPDGTDLTNLTPGRTATMPSTSPDGQRVVYVAADGVVVQDVATGAVQQPFANTMFARSPRWSPDGQWIAYVRSGQLFVVRPDGSDLRRMSSFGIVDAGLSWSPDSRRLPAWPR
jgi:hypothetical protein